jgi:hypothetical protein
MKQNQWAAVLLAVLLFCCGAAIGALGDHFYTVRANAKTAEDFRHRYISEMRSRCKLTPAQVAQLEAILDDTKAKVKVVKDSVRPQILKIKQEQIGRVKSILTAEQVPAYEQLLAERERRAKDQEERDRREQQNHAAAPQQQPAR